MPVDPALAAVAQQASSDPSNPWLSGVVPSPDQPAPPTQAPPDPIAGNPAAPYTPPTTGKTGQAIGDWWQRNMVAPFQKPSVANPGAGPAPAAPEVRQPTSFTREVQPTDGTPPMLARAEEMRAAKPAVPGAPAGPSPDRQWLAGSQDLNREGEARLEQQKAAMAQAHEDLANGVAYQEALGKKNLMTLEADQADQRSQERDLQFAANGRATERQRRAEEIRNQHVDPQHWFKEKGTAGSILAAIAMGAGAFGANMPHSGGQNAAMKIIDDAVNRDVQSQKDDIDNQWKELNYQGDEDEKNYVRGQHALNQNIQRSLTTYDHAQALINQQLQNTNLAAEHKQNLIALSGQIDEKKQNLEQQSLNQARDVANSERRAQMAQANAAQLQEKKIQEEAAKNFHDPNFQAKDPGMTREEAAWRAAHATVTGDLKNAGVADVAKGGAAAGKLSPKLAVRVEAAERGLSAATALDKDNPYVLMGNPEAQQNVESLKGAIKSMDPNADVGWVDNPMSPSWRGRVKAVQKELAQHHKGLIARGTGGGGDEEPGEVEGAEER